MSNFSNRNLLSCGNLRFQMALPTSYLTSTKNLDAIFAALRNAKAPEKFTTRFLESLDFRSAADRLVIGVLKSLGFLDGEGRPQDRYFRFLDQTQSTAVLAEGLREAYGDLFQVNTKAQNLSKSEVVNKFKTLSQGQISESVLDKMAMTFAALVKLADFDAKAEVTRAQPPQEEIAQEEITPPLDASRKSARPLGGLHYNIILPEAVSPSPAWAGEGG